VTKNGRRSGTMGTIQHRCDTVTVTGEQPLVTKRGFSHVQWRKQFTIRSTRRDEALGRLAAVIGGSHCQWPSEVTLAGAELEVRSRSGCEPRSVRFREHRVMDTGSVRSRVLIKCPLARGRG
jgi:hypothetical protein